jgi:hypothetical protein
MRGSVLQARPGDIALRHKNGGVHHLQQFVLLRGHSIGLPNPALNKNKKTVL